jgi:TRAP transporter 4TM/12TM fusion protein
LDGLAQRLFNILATALGVFVLAEVNYPHLTPQAQLSLFALLGLSLVYLKFPLHPGWSTSPLIRWLDLVPIIGVVYCFGYVLVHNEALFAAFWPSHQPLGNRAGMEITSDHLIGALGLLLVLEAARRAIGIFLPLLALTFLAYAALGPLLPDWLFPHRGYTWERIVSQTFLHSQGVFGIALKVMFSYVYLFVLFGAVLERTGATGYIINLAQRLFHHSPGGSAKVAVLSSGLMGSLSGSAVANTATTGTFTIPLMRSAGFAPHTAAAIEAAASSGGALVPPIMGAGAYMMLEIIEPAVSYLQIIKAALLPALLYYTALLLIVHLTARRSGSTTAASSNQTARAALSKAQGWTFFSAFIVLILLLLLGYTPFRAVSLSLLAVLAVSVCHRDTRISLRDLFSIFARAAQGGVALIAAAACVGLIIGVVTLTGIGTQLPSVIIPLAQDNIILALMLLMVSTIILGMGLPSAVCYLIMATLIGPVLSRLGLVPLAAHLFIFYFGMMSMVTPPVALAAYTAAAIARSPIMATSLAAFRFALVGFALPYAFVLRPALLFLGPDGQDVSIFNVGWALVVTLAALLPMAAAVAGYLIGPLALWHRLVLFAAALVFFLVPAELTYFGYYLIAALVCLGILWVSQRQPIKV